MARGQAIAIRCPSCRDKSGWVPTATGERRKRTYEHGHWTGLPTSRIQWRVVCPGCAHAWWSRHPDAELAYDRRTHNEGA